MTPEGKIKALIDKLLRSYGDDIKVIKPIGTMYGEAGVSDYILCAYGFAYAIEAKKDSAKDGVNSEKGLSPHQKRFKKLFIQAHGTYHRVGSEADLEVVKAELEKLKFYKKYIDDMLQ